MWWIGLTLALSLVPPASAQDVTALEASARAADAERDAASGDAQVAAAERAIAAWQAVVDALALSGALVLRTEPPEAVGDPPRVEAIPLPAALAGLVTARGRYLGLAGRDPERAAALDLENALVLHRWGHVELARERLWRIYLEHCREESERWQIAWTALYQLAVRRNAVPAARALVDHYGAARCARPEAPPSDDPADPRNMASSPLDPGPSPALVTYQQAEEARAAGRTDEARALYERAATRLVEAVDRQPDHPDAPRALLLAGRALVLAGRYRAAIALFARAADGAEHTTAEDAVTRDHLLAVAVYQLGETSRLALDLDDALAAWSRLTEEDRFARSEDPEMPAMIRDALAAQVQVLRALERRAERVPLLERLLASPVGEAERRAYLRELLDVVQPIRVGEIGDRLLATYDDTTATLADRLAVLAAMEERVSARRARARIATRIDQLVATVAPPAEGEVPSDAARFAARRELDALTERFLHVRGTRARAAFRADLEAMARWRLLEIDRAACGLLREMGPSGSLGEPVVCRLPDEPTPPRETTAETHAAGSIDARE